MTFAKHTTPVADHLKTKQDRHNELVDMHDECVEMGMELAPDKHEELLRLIEELANDPSSIIVDEDTDRDLCNV